MRRTRFAALIAAVLTALVLAAPALAQAPAEPPTQPPPVEDELLKQLLDEPDPPAAADPLADIAGRMRLAGDRLDATRVDADTRRIQDSVSADLARLIAEAQKRQQQQQQSQQQQQQQQQQSQREQVQQPQPQPSGEGKDGKEQQQSQSNQAARDSTMQLQKQAAAKATGADRASLLKRVWGHLPEQARQQVQSSTSEQFVPKYELETEQYFRRLAELEAGP